MIPLGEAMGRLSRRLTGHQQVTDAYLIALATHNDGKLVTLDAKLVQIGPADKIEVIS